MRDPELLSHQEWLGYLQPVGLVVSPLAMVAAQAFPAKNIIPDHTRFLELIEQVTLEGGVVPSGAVWAAAGAAAKTPAPRSARACRPAVARKLVFLIIISRIGAPFSATPLVRGRNPPHVGIV